jgi:deoxyribose-phosphate aldolase
MDRRRLAAHIDSTLLASDALPGQVDRLVDEAVELGFAAVCINPIFVPRVRDRLDGEQSGSTHRVKLCAVASFPLGAVSSMQRAAEATMSVKAGAEEIDLVPWLPLLLERKQSALRDELLTTVRAVRAVNPTTVVKVILETTALQQAATNDVEYEQMIEVGCAAARESGCDFVKTSTGFHPAGGATIDAVALLKKHAGGLRVKASGGIRDYDTAMEMLGEGADRLGCSAGATIVEGASS